MRGCAKSNEAHPCHREVVAVIQQPAGSVGVCSRHIWEYEYFEGVPLKELLSQAWEEGHMSDEYKNPWN